MGHKLKELAKTAKDVTSHAIKHKKVLTEKYEERLSICNKCHLFNRQMSLCTRCGCYMKAKARLEAAKCPISKW